MLVCGVCESLWPSGKALGWYAVCESLWPSGKALGWYAVCESLWPSGKALGWYADDVGSTPLLLNSCGSWSPSCDCVPHI